MLNFPNSNQCASQDSINAQCTLCDIYGNSFESFAGLVASPSHLHTNIIKHCTG